MKVIYFSICNKIFLRTYFLQNGQLCLNNMLLVQNRLLLCPQENGPQFKLFRLKIISPSNQTCSIHPNDLLLGVAK